MERPTYEAGENVIIQRQRDEMTWASVVEVGNDAPYPITIRIGRDILIVAACIVYRPGEWPGFTRRVSA